jgi:Mn2+/Fe2+ NRAMP family transporter
MKNKFASIILWSVISAAFIGPGTVATAVSAGSRFQLDLLWTVVFATIACIIIQETAARITISSGLNLGQTFRMKFGDRWGRIFQFVIGWIVIGGCAAFEAGNLVGAAEGLSLVVNTNQVSIIVIISLAAALLLWLDRPYWISGLMLILVALMGMSFVILAQSNHYSAIQLASKILAPSFPAGSGLVMLGLIGTTIVPYNIFLGSGISQQQTIPMMRIGLISSVLLGGLVTAFILVAGTVVNDFTSFDELMFTFSQQTGSAGVFALAAGLFGAGFSSSVTAPFAASIIASSVFGWKKWRLLLVYVFVLLTGVLVGISDVKPVPLIITVQALNGIILPLLVLFLIIIVNDKKIVPERYRPGIVYNILLMLVLIVVVSISAYQVSRVLGKL